MSNTKIANEINEIRENGKSLKLLFDYYLSYSFLNKVEVYANSKVSMCLI